MECTSDGDNGLVAYLLTPSLLNSFDAKVRASCGETRAILLISSCTLEYSVMNKWAYLSYCYMMGSLNASSFGSFGCLPVESALVSKGYNSHLFIYQQRDTFFLRLIPT